MAKANKKAPLGPEWMAGFMDGEGTFSLASRKSRNGRKCPYWEPVVSVVNTNLDAMLLVREAFGGSMWGNADAASKNPAHKECFQIKWYGDEAMALTEILLPFLVLKKRQAELVLEYMISIRETPSPGRRGHSADVIDIRTRLANQVQSLNKRGA